MVRDFRPITVKVWNEGQGKIKPRDPIKPITATGQVEMWELGQALLFYSLHVFLFNKIQQQNMNRYIRKLYQFKGEISNYLFI